MAVLINGPQNAVIVYELKSNRNAPLAEAYFETTGYIENGGSPKSADVTRTHLSRTQTSTSILRIQKTLYLQQVTMFNFNPQNRRLMCMSGPNGMLMVYKVDTGQITREGDGGCNEILRETGINVNFTYQHFCEDAGYLAACTDDGNVVVQKMAPIEVVYSTQIYDDDNGPKFLV